MKNAPAIVAIFVSVAVIVIIVVLYRRGRYRVEQGELAGENVISGMETWDTKSNEVIKKLHPKLRDKVSSFINELSGIGIKYRVYSGFRSFDEQAALYGKGRTVLELTSVGVDSKYAKPTETKVTNAKPGTSYHNYGLAIDGVEVKDSKALWISPNEAKIVTVATKYGLFWGGNFSTLKDKPHFEDKQYGSVAQLLALYNGGKKDINGYLIV